MRKTCGMTNQSKNSIDLASALMLLALAAVWGGTFYFAEVALTEVPPLTITLHRVLWAVPVLYIVIRAKGLHMPLDARSWIGFLVMGALNNALPFSLIFWGQTFIEGGLASILNATTGVFGAVVAGLMLKDEPLLPRKMLGAIFGVIGVAVIMGLDQLLSLDLRNLAQIAILGAALSYSFAGVWGKTKLSGNPPLVNAMGMLVGSVVIMIPIVLLVDGVPDVTLTMPVWSALIAMAVVSTSLAYFLYFSILARAGSANLMLVTLLIPPFAIGLGSFFLAESLDTRVYVGLLVIGIGLIITDGRAFRVLRSVAR